MDGDILCYRAAFSCNGPLDTKEDAIAKLDELIFYVFDFLDIGLFDTDTYRFYLTGRGNFRETIAKSQVYKGNRSDTPKPCYLSILREYMISRYGAVVSQDEEADDLIAIEAALLNYKCTVVSVDKDFHQLPTRNYNPTTGVLKSIAPDEATKFFYTQILTGDRADNIKGIHGVGPAKASKILGNYSSEETLARLCIEAYCLHYGICDRQAEELVLEAGQLLWLRRFKGQMWQLPKVNWEKELS